MKPATVSAIAIDPARRHLQVSDADVSRLTCLSIKQQAAACEASHIAILHFDEARRLLRFNDAFARFLGHDREYLLGRSIDELLVPEDVAPDRAALQALSTGPGEISRSERRYRHASGRHAWAEVECVVVRGPGGRIDFLSATLIDIGERKFLERRLGSLAAVIEQTSDFVALFDQRLNVQYINAAGLRLLGLPSREAFERSARPNVLDWVWQDDLAMVRDVAIPAIQKSGSWNGRVRYRHAVTGEAVPTVFNVSAIRDESGRITSYSTLSPDLAQIVAAEQALRHKSEELAAANRQKDKVLARLGHELRNPMNALINGLCVLGASESEEETHAMLSMMTRQAGQLDALIADLSDVARAQSGHLSVAARVTRIDRFVTEVVDERRYETQPLGIRMETHIDGVIGARVSMDGNRIRQVLNNLLGNAIRAMQGTSRAGRIRIDATLDEDTVTIAVSDNGRGIDDANLERIFEPFERVAGDRSDGGLGLGLAISRELVQLHQGNLTVSSEGAGLGATFRLSLPLHDVVAPADRAFDELDDTIESPGPDETACVADRTSRIVIIDDEQDASDAMRRMLERFGHETHRAMDGPSGIALALEVQPDIVICDIGMPGMNGFEVARRLRKRALFDSTRLIALTGFADERTARDACDAGFSEHVAKPISGAALKALISH